MFIQIYILYIYIYIFGSNNFHGIPSVLPVPEARCARLSDLALAVAAAAYQRMLVPSGVGEVWQVSGLSLRKSGCNWNCMELSQFQGTDFNFGYLENSMNDAQ